MPYQQPDGRWRAVKKIAGHRKQKIFRTKAEAKKWEAEQNREAWLEEQTRLACLFDVADAYLTDSKARHHPTTYADKKRAISIMLSYVKAGDGPDAMPSRMALKIVMDKVRSCSNAAGNKLRKHLAAFWQYAVQFYDYPKENPFQNVRKLPENSEPHYVPPVHDFWRVFSVADEVDRAMLLCLLYTAGRRSEPLRWTWEDDIDLEFRRIRLSTCKTASGSRRYEWKPMPSRLYTTLLHYREKCSGKGYVFRNKNNGEKYESRNQFIRYLCKRARVKPFNYHGIRGLCATLLAANNVPMKQIQSVLMHSNMTTTDRYVRSIGGVSDELVMAFERFGDGAAACNVAIEAAN